RGSGAKSAAQPLGSRALPYCRSPTRIESLASLAAALEGAARHRVRPSARAACKGFGFHLGIAVSRYLWNRTPDGLLEPCTLVWQLRHERPIRRSSGAPPVARPARVCRSLG